MNPEKRKRKSELLLNKLGSDFLPSLPLIESEKDSKLHTSKEISKRIICLACTAAYVNGVNKENLLSWLNNEYLYQELTDDEISLFNRKEISQKDINRFSWRTECIWLLLWSLNYINKFIVPIEQCSVQDVLKFIPTFGEDTTKFINKSKIRNKSEILDMSDFLYRAHWATRQYEIDSSTKIGKLNPDIVVEWHYAINWLTYYDDIENWDDITTDT